MYWLYTYTYYDDKTTAYRAEKSLYKFIRNVKSKLFKTNVWLCPNKLSLNFAKSLYSISSKK